MGNDNHDPEKYERLLRNAVVNLRDLARIERGGQATAGQWRDSRADTKVASEALDRAATQGFAPAASTDAIVGVQDFQQHWIDQSLRNLSAIHEMYSALVSGGAKGLTNQGVSAFRLFISHAKADEKKVAALKAKFANRKYFAYVDWIDDPDLDRTHVDRETIDRLRARMMEADVGVLALSRSSAGSFWVQWELGFLDALSGQIVIVPIEPGALEAIRDQQYARYFPVVEDDDPARGLAEKLHELPLAK